METLTPADYSAMQACIDIMRRESPDCANQIDAKIKFEGYEAAGEFAACHVQSDVLKLRPWEVPPCNIWGHHCANAIALRDRLLAAGVSVFVPDPMQAIDEAERAKIETVK
jgi:hypothetical protein